jgi:deoxyribodipyrimidine photolyase-like uncharacterized protein
VQENEVNQNRKSETMKTLRLILGDQLNRRHSWFREVDPDTVYCLFEMRQERDCEAHHIQKVNGTFPHRALRFAGFFR